MHVVHYSSANQRNAMIMIMIMNQNLDIALENDCTELHKAVAAFISNHQTIYWNIFISF